MTILDRDMSTNPNAARRLYVGVCKAPTDFEWAATNATQAGFLMGVAVTQQIEYSAKYSVHTPYVRGIRTLLLY